MHTYQHSGSILCLGPPSLIKHAVLVTTQDITTPLSDGIYMYAVSVFLALVVDREGSLVEVAGVLDGGGILVPALETDLGETDCDIEVDAVILVLEVLPGDGDGLHGVEDGIGANGLDGARLALTRRVGDGTGGSLGIGLPPDGEVDGVGRLNVPVLQVANVVDEEADLGPVVAEARDDGDRFGRLRLGEAGRGDGRGLDTDVRGRGVLGVDADGEALLGVGEGSHADFPRHATGVVIVLHEHAAAGQLVSIRHD